jgi:tetratricopeptide (TPR) repeat protein
MEFLMLFEYYKFTLRKKPVVKVFILPILFFFGLILHGKAQQSPNELFQKAMELKKTRDCEQILLLLNKAIEQKPDFTEAMLEKGWCLNELNRPNEAIPVLIRAKTLAKNNYQVYYELAHAYYSINNSDSALKYFKETLKSKPDHFLAMTGIGDLQREKNANTSGAIQWYQKALRIDSNHKRTNYWIGWCYNDNKKYDSAIYYLQKVLLVDPSNSLASVEVGYALYSLDRYNEAFEAFKPALAAKPRPESAIFYSGMCLVKKGSKAEALDRYNELVILNSVYASQLLAEIQKMK